MQNFLQQIPQTHIRPLSFFFFFQTKKLLFIYINYWFLMHKTVGRKKKLEQFLHSCRESINKL